MPKRLSYEFRNLFCLYFVASLFYQDLVKTYRFLCTVSVYSPFLNPPRGPVGVTRSHVCPINIHIK